MDFLFKFVTFTLCLHFVWCSVGTYKAAYVRDGVSVRYHPRLIHEASEMNADILVLPSPAMEFLQDPIEMCSADKNDEVIKSISAASRKGKLYVVAQLLESMLCQGQHEIIRNNMVFDRDGSIIAVYRKPLMGSAECNITNIVASTFTTDFGVTFGLLMEEDLVLKNVEDIKSVKNFVLAGKFYSNIPFVRGNTFSSSWSYATNANLIWSTGIAAGRTGLKTGSGQLVVTELSKDAVEDQPTIKFNGPMKLKTFPVEDLSQYTIRPLDIEASSRGYRETVCHGTFCCNFGLKTSLIGNPKEVNYGLLAFSGIQQYDQLNNIAMQNCAVLACAGLYKRSCFLSSENTTNVIFDELSISANFPKNSAQFPIIYSIPETTVKAKDFTMQEEITDNQKHVTAKLYNMKDVLQFGVFGRDYSRDFGRSFENKTSPTQKNKTPNSCIYFDYISSENVGEFFDYLWIRLRVVIFVVSIYILEMI